MSENVTIFEVGPRDGLQNEKVRIDTPSKVRLVDMLSASGLKKIEVTSFVSPKWVPQMSDAAEVLRGITRHSGVTYAALIPNLRGLEAALQEGVDEVAIFASASEGFSQKNINCSIEESFERFGPVMEAAKAAGVSVRGYVSCVTDCPYDGPVSPEQTANVARRMLEIGCYEVSLGDTIGAATPQKTKLLMQAVLGVASPEHFAGHFHDTSGNALANIEVCLGAGLRCFDAAVGGLGGCPFAPGAKGNVATEAVATMLRDAGLQTGLDLQKLNDAAQFARTLRTGD